MADTTPLTQGAGKTGDKQWSHGIFECFGTSPVDFALGCCCPCILNAQSRNRYDQSNLVFNCLCMTGPAVRNVIREGYHIEGDCLSDIIFGAFCGQCNACQLAREVEVRGRV